LAQLWEEVLAVRPVGVRDDFFALGGHSLAAAQLFSRIERRFGKRLALATLTYAPTVEQLARVIRNGSDVPASCLVPIQARGEQPPFFCVHGFGGGVIGYGALAQQLGPERPFFGLQARGVDGEAEPDDSIPAMAARYMEALRAVQPRGPYRLGGYCFGGVVAYEMACQLQAQGERVALLAVLAGYAPASV